MLYKIISNYNFNRKLHKNYKISIYNYLKSQDFIKGQIVYEENHSAGNAQIINYNIKFRENILSS